MKKVEIQPQNHLEIEGIEGFFRLQSNKIREQCPTTLDLYSFLNIKYIANV
jgi:hypothetical protein